MKFIFVILCIALVSNEGLAEKCNEADLKTCLYELENTVVKQMLSIQKAEKDLSSYCTTLKQEGKCLEDMSKSCETDFPKISTALSTFHTYLSGYCGENAKMYMDMIPCFEKHKDAFQKCKPHEKSKREVVPMDDTICKEVESMEESMECVAQVSKDKCENGKTFGNALEKRMKSMKSDLCSGAGYLVNSFWTFATTVFSVLLIRNKLQ